MTLPRLPGNPDDRDMPVIVEPRRQVLEVVENGTRVVYLKEPVAFPHEVEVVMPNFHHGVGPPGVIVGAQPGDFYIDDSNGDLYRLS